LTKPISMLRAPLLAIASIRSPQRSTDAIHAYKLTSRPSPLPHFRRLYELGFAEQLREILSRLPHGRQTLLFSATLPKLLVEFARAGLTNPTLVRLDVENKLSDQLWSVLVLSGVFCDYALGCLSAPHVGPAAAQHSSHRLIFCIAPLLARNTLLSVVRTRLACCCTFSRLVDLFNPPCRQRKRGRHF